jgi:hypothetical protein
LECDNTVHSNTTTTETESPSEDEVQRAYFEHKMRTVFGDEMKKLSEDLQSALADDIVTAFLNRISLFVKIDSEKKRYTRTKRSLKP